MSIDIRVDLRKHFGQVRNQGDERPTCLPIAVSDTHQSARMLRDLLSVEWMFYYSCIGPSGRSNVSDGTTISDTRHVLRHIGQPLESKWPYSMVSPEPSSWKPPNVSKSDLYATNSHLCKKLSPKIVWSNLENGIPVIVILTITLEFRSKLSCGLTTEIPVKLSSQGKELGNHGIVVVGCGYYKRKRVFLIRNSWGKNWGFKGHAWIYENYLALRLKEGFIIQKCDVV